MSFINFIRRILGYFKRKKIMSLTQNISDDQAAIAAAQSVLDAASAKLASDQAVLDTLQPHIAAWDAVEAYANASIYNDIKADLLALVATGRAALDL